MFFKNLVIFNIFFPFQLNLPGFGVLMKNTLAKGSTARNKRFLLTPAETQYGAFITVSVPLQPDTTVSMAWFFEANYYTTADASYFHPLIGIEPETSIRKTRDIEEPKEMITRTLMYTLLETMFKRHGFGGRACLLRAICENSRAHFLHNGVIGDLIHLLLTPSASKSEEHIEDEFYIAEHLGNLDECFYYEYDCPQSPLDYISLLTE